MNKILLRKFNIFLLLISGLLLITCNRQPSGEASVDNLEPIREEMLVVLDKIDVALESNSIGDFSNKTSDAVSDLDNHIEKYVDEMYSRESKITEESINRLMVIKQKKVEMEFKLALLQKETNPSDTTRTSLSHSDTVITIHNATGTAVNQRRRAEEGRRAEEERRTETDRREDAGLGSLGTDMPAPPNQEIERPAADHTATDLSITDTLISPFINEEPISTEGLHQALVKDLRELRKEVELFVQSDL